MSDHQTRANAPEPRNRQSAGYPDLLPETIVATGARQRDHRGSQGVQIAAYRLIMALSLLPAAVRQIVGVLAALRLSPATPGNGTHGRTDKAAPAS